MREHVEIANIEFGADDDGKKTAVVTFKVTDENPIPSALNFEIEIMVRHDSDVAGVVSVAKRAFHALTSSLADQTEEWVRAQP